MQSAGQSCGANLINHMNKDSSSSGQQAREQKRSAGRVHSHFAVLSTLSSEMDNKVDLEISDDDFDY